MKRVYLECRGRLANQILCYANAVCVFDRLGIKDRQIVVSYPELSPAILPGAVVAVVDMAPVGLPRVTRDELLKQEGDCLWVWEDVYSDFPHALVMQRIIQTIRFQQEAEPWPKNHHRVGVHVRYGDYVEVDPKNPPSPMPPFPRAPKEYFLNAINLCRERDLMTAFMVASDGTPAELAFLHGLSGVFVDTGNTALMDLIMLSQCRLIIGSNSTFSTVASWYGNVPMTSPAMTEAEMRQTIASALL